LSSKQKIVLSGALLGALAVALVLLGNPLNMGFCIACFWRDITGAIGLHRAEVVQYIRPEIIGLIIGSFIISKFTGEFKVRGGSSPIIRFFLGVAMMVGALVFLGCPLRAILRLANGDLNAAVGLAGYVGGIFIGAQFIKKGFTLGRSYSQSDANGYVIPVSAVLLMIALIVAPSFILFSQEGPGSMHAAIGVSLAAGLVLGVVLQRTRLCTAGGIRDLILIKDFHLFFGLVAIFVVTLAGNLIFNFESFKLGFEEQPIAHTEHLWNVLGMVLVGISAVLLGGCPLRQTILSGQGDVDAGITVIGMIFGAAISHNFGLAASPKGVPADGKIAVVAGIVLVCIIAYSIVLSEGKKRKSAKGVK
jgi:uncharacterized protein